MYVRHRKIGDKRMKKEIEDEECWQVNRGKDSPLNLHIDTLRMVPLDSDEIMTLSKDELIDMFYEDKYPVNLFLDVINKFRELQVPAVNVNTDGMTLGILRKGLKNTIAQLKIEDVKVHDFAAGVVLIKSNFEFEVFEDKDGNVTSVKVKGAF